MKNCNGHLLSKIEVSVFSHEPELDWILRTNDFETELNDGQTNLIDLVSDNDTLVQMKKSSKKWVFIFFVSEVKL